jgi:methyl-accepting chemotaxis protein
MSALGSIAALLVAMMMVGWIALSSTDHAMQSLYVDRVYPLGDLKAVADAYAVDIVDSTHKVRLKQLGAAEAVDNIARAKTVVSSAWNRYLSTTMDGEERQIADAVQSAMLQADDTVSRIEALLRAGDEAGLERLVGDQFYPTFDRVSSEIGRLVGFQLKAAQGTAGEVSRAFRAASMSMIALMVIGMAVVAVATFTVLRGVVRPIGAITAVMTNLANDMLRVQIPGTRRRDEVGAMARALQVFRRQLLDMDNLRLQQRVIQEQRLERARRLECVVMQFESSATEVVNSLSAAATELQVTAQGLADHAEVHCGLTPNPQDRRAGRIGVTAGEDGLIELGVAVLAAAGRLARSTHQFKIQFDAFLDEVRRV